MPAPEDVEQVAARLAAALGAVVDHVDFRPTSPGELAVESAAVAEARAALADYHRSFGAPDRCVTSCEVHCHG